MGKASSLLFAPIHDKMGENYVNRIGETIVDKKRILLKRACIGLGILLLLLIAAIAFDMTVDRSGWSEKDGSYSYRDFHGRKITGWLTVDGNTYYFGDDTIMVTGWQDIDGSRYYFDVAGIMATGWKNVDTARYYFGSDGVLRTGWLELDGKRYYLAGDGAMVSGWQDIGGGTVYFGENGAQIFGWNDLEGSTYYFDKTGHLVTGYTELDGNRYYFQEDGKLFTGWEDTEEGRRYYGPDGPQVFGWTEIEDELYFFDQDGWMQTGWISVGEYRYYLRENGAAAVGPRDIDGQRYYFSPKGIQVVLVNSSHKVPSYYKPDLVDYIPWHQVSSVCLEPLKEMLADCVAAGYEYEFNSAYRSIKTQEEILWLRTQEYISAGYDNGAAYAKARQTVALPGTSEHHLGLAVDILNVKKAERKALDWLGEHCWEYGFILRYTQEKAHITGIIDEPWHFRYVGTEVSMDMKDSGLCLEEYLGAVPIE